jgi:hypothetical protein
MLAIAPTNASTAECENERQLAYQNAEGSDEWVVMTQLQAARRLHRGDCLFPAVAAAPSE